MKEYTMPVRRRQAEPESIGDAGGSYPDVQKARPRSVSLLPQDEEDRRAAGNWAMLPPWRRDMQTVEPGTVKVATSPKASTFAAPPPDLAPGGPQDFGQAPAKRQRAEAEGAAPAQSSYARPRTRPSRPLGKISRRPPNLKLNPVQVIKDVRTPSNKGEGQKVESK